jgi:hypothetical protein
VPVGPICNGQPQCQQGVYCAACAWAGWNLPVPSPPTSSYDVTTAGVVIDTVTGLWWQQPIDLTNTQNKNCASGCTQAQAIAYCANLTLAGHCDWRLPTRIELVSIVDYTKSSGTINGTAFPNTPSASFWTSSPYAPSAGNAWHIHFNDGSVDTTSVGSTDRVRCVR